ncbi:MAG TPA: caspase family protein, partial [Candidatus Portnoybacteria bacterium]|nr:caspase family protein [Candidatus Portnoybacteria bacterium]
SWPKFPSFFHFHHFHFHQSAATGVLGEPVEGNKYAIVIGISDYPETANDLQYADDDAQLVASILENQYSFNPANIYTFINASATAPAIYNQVEELKNKINPDDELVFYFSGHGARGIANDGDNEIIDEAIVVNNKDNSNVEYLWDGQLKQWFDNFPTSRLAFVFDSCLAGGMTDLAADGRVISMATRESGLFDSATEGQQWGGGHGEFTYYFFIQGIEKSRADLNSKNGIVSNEEAFDYAKSNCQSDRPTISDQFENDLVW